MIVQQVSVHQNAYEANFGCRGETCPGQTAQQDSASKNAVGQFLFYAENLAFILRNESGWAVINQIEPRQRIVYHENHGWKCV
jgi:hypothetical protein